MCFNPAEVQFQVLLQHSGSFVSLKQLGKFIEAHTLLLEPTGVTATGRDRPSEVNDATWFLCYALLEHMNNLFSNFSLYEMRDEWSELDEFGFPRDRLPLVFAMSPESSNKPLNIVRPRFQQLDVSKIEQDGNTVKMLDSQPVLTSLYRKRSLLFSAAKCGVPRLGIASTISINKCTM